MSELREREREREREKEREKEREREREMNFHENQVKIINKISYQYFKFIPLKRLIFLKKSLTLRRTIRNKHHY